MQVRVKLMGALKDKTPVDERLDLPAAATIEDALQSLEITAPQIQIVMVNGRPQPDRSQALSPDDELTVLPPVGGG